MNMRVVEISDTHDRHGRLSHALPGGDVLVHSRDPGFAAPNNIGLTAGLEFTLVP